MGVYPLPHFYNSKTLDRLNQELKEAGSSSRSTWTTFQWHDQELDFEILTWIRDWHKQFLEHMGYLELLMIGVPAANLVRTPDGPLVSPLHENNPQIGRASWEELDQGAVAVSIFKPLCSRLAEGWKKVENELMQDYDSGLVNMDQLRTLCEWTMGVKDQMLQVQRKQRIWIGNNWSSLVEHMAEELLAFCWRVSGHFNYCKKSGSSTTLSPITRISWAISSIHRGIKKSEN